MSNLITQEDYDEVVKEFMEDFLMTAEEAIDDAVRHFETQVSIPASFVYSVRAARRSMKSIALLFVRAIT